MIGNDGHAAFSVTNFKKSWQPFLKYRSVLFGAILISLVWTTLFFFLKNEHESAERAAIQNSTNLAGALEEHLLRSLSEIDRTLLIVRTLYERDKNKLDLAAWLKSSRALNDEDLKVSIVDSDGNVRLSSDRAVKHDSGEAAQYRDAVDSSIDKLTISKPKFNQSTGHWSIQFSRPIGAADKSLKGAIVAALDPGYLTRIYNSVDIGRDGYIRVFGLDGIVRATSGRTLSVLGKDFSGADLFKRTSAAGWYYTRSNLSDSVSRLIAYRSVSGFPLVITVGLASHDIFSRLDAQKKSGYLIAIVMTLLILAATVFSVRGHILRDRAKRHLEHTNMLLNATLENMPQGICMFGADKQLVLANDLYSKMYGLNPEDVKPGTTLPEILQARIRAGSCPQDTQKYIKDRIEEAFLPDPGYVINELRDGRTFSVSRKAMPDGGSVAVHQDITAHLHAERELGEAKQFLNSIIENVPVAVVVKDAVTRKFMLVNRAFEAMLKVTRADVVGKTVFDIYRTKDAERIDATDSEALAGVIGAYPSDYEIEMPVGHSRILATSRIVVRDSQGTPKHLIVVIEDVTERKRSEQRIAFMAHHDVLTGLANRLAIMEKIEEAVARHRRRGDPFAVLLLDLDRFKHVNDTLGHAVGDALLRETAARLKASLRETDVLARLGGDEFAIVQDGDHSQREAASALADRIIDVISKPFYIEGNEVNIATSIGIALAPEHAASSDSLMKMADLALYRAKSAGRNGYRFFDPEMSLAASARHELESDLRRAIQQDELEMFYQPIVDTKTRRNLRCRGADPVAASDKGHNPARPVYSACGRDRHDHAYR